MGGGKGGIGAASRRLLGVEALDGSRTAAMINCENILKVESAELGR